MLQYNIINNILLSGITYRITRIALGGIFIYSGWLKLIDLSSFAEVIGGFGLVPLQIRGITALLISSCEIIAGAGLIMEIKGCLAAVLLMLILFMMALVYGIKMGFDIDCGCFGNDDPVGAAFHGLRASLVRDLIFISLTTYLYIWRKLRAFQPTSPFSYYKYYKNLVHKKP